MTHACALTGSLNLTVMTPSGSAWRGARGRELDRHNTTDGATHVIEHDIRDLSQGRAFIADLFFEVEQERLVFLQFLQREHALQHDDAPVLVRSVRLVLLRDRRPEPVLVVPLAELPVRQDRARACE